MGALGFAGLTATSSDPVLNRCSNGGYGPLFNQSLHERCQEQLAWMSASVFAFLGAGVGVVVGWVVAAVGFVENSRARRGERSGSVPPVDPGLARLLAGEAGRGEGAGRVAEEEGRP